MLVEDKGNVQQTVVHRELDNVVRVKGPRLRLDDEIEEEENYFLVQLLVDVNGIRWKLVYLLPLFARLPALKAL